MVTISKLSELLEQHLAKLKLEQQPQQLYAPIKYILEDRGKRMRPLLMMLACDAYGNNVKSCIDFALGIEVFHNFTLLHDDIMDKAKMRRGRETVHVKWCDNIAILSGDAMIILAYMQFAKANEDVDSECLIKILKIFNKAAIEVCEGQQLDMNFESANDVTIEQYINMIRLKTSVLLAAALQIGAMVGGASEKKQNMIYEFGVNLGLAFQIQDDILDTYGNGETFGKNIGGDIAVGKKTFLLLSAMKLGDQNQKNRLLNSRDYNVVKAIYDVLDVKNIAFEAVQYYYNKAIESLDAAMDNSLSVELKSYAEVLLKRDK